MRQHDFDAFEQKIAALAETLGKAPPTARAMVVWFDTLKAFPTDQVFGLIGDWPRLSSRMPAPSDVWSKLNDAMIERRESAAAAEREQHRREHVAFVRSPHGKRILGEMSALLAKCTPMTPKTIAQGILDRIVEGQQPAMQQLEYVTEFSGLDTDQIAEMLEIGERNRAEKSEQPELAVADDGAPW